MAQEKTMTPILTIIADLEAKKARATPTPYEAADNQIFAPALKLKGERGDVLAEFYGGNPAWGDNSNDTEFVAAAANAVPELIVFAKHAVKLLDELSSAEEQYRSAHDLRGDGSNTAGYMWDQMRRTGDRARAFLEHFGCGATPDT